MKTKLSARIISIFLAVMMVVTILPSGMLTASAADSKVEAAINWAVSIANNDSYGYSQVNRYGNPDYDCSSLVSTAFHNAGFNVSCSLNTRTMKQAFINAGFTWIPASQIANFPSKSWNLQRGDILLASGHTELYVGNNQNVGAHANYNGIPGGIGGGSSWSSGWKKYRYGKDEISVESYWNDNWLGVLRYEKDTPPPPAALATTPNVSADVRDIAVGKNAHISWNSQNAVKYDLEITYPNGRKTSESTTWTSKDLILYEEGTYSFRVKAYNSDNKETSWSSSVSVTTHGDVTVNFEDWDGTSLGTQTIRYGESASTPDSPLRKGYTFQGWDGSYRNVTSDRTIRATYKINTYTVNFYDRKGNIIGKPQKVKYGEDAVPPTDVNSEDNYEFIGWNSTDYMNVYTDRADKNINIDGVYSWYNHDLPAVCKITEATRQYEGYNVTLNIENNDSKPTTGRVVVAIKTSEGKLVEMTESTAFSIPAGKTKNGIEVFIPCYEPATKMEVYMVADYSSGVPISPMVTTDIKEGLMYAESTVKPNDPNGILDVQEVTQYSYRDKEFSTGNTQKKDDWEYVGTRSEQAGGWSGWGWNWIGSYDTESKRREVQTQSAVQSYNYKNVYHYYHCHLSNGNVTPTWNANTAHYLNLDWELAWQGTSSVGNTPYYGYYSDGGCKNIWYRLNDFVTQEVVSANYGTQYRYRDINYLYNFYRWKNWTGWSDTYVAENANREVKTRTIYRYQSNKPQIEDTTGEIRTVSGKLDKSFAGKQITLYVYGYTGASDYTNEFMGQSVVGEDGSYSFTFKLREEASIKTGDFTVAIGIEGTTNTTVIGTIEAPKPTYTVKFYDWDGTILDTQTVVKGENAVLPENPEKEGHNFIGWDKSNVNITENTDIFADFAEKEFTVVFVDWGNKQLEIKKFAYGDALTVPENALVEGYTFNGWDEIKDGNIIVTQDMVVTAEYEINTYTVKFYDFDGNVVSTQDVEYGSSAETPDNIGESEDGKQFAGWFNPEEYEHVDHDVAIYPSYYFEETTDVPTANYESGEYDDKIELSLNSADENAVIFYYLNGDETTEQIYTKPITIDKTCSVTYYASSFGKNDSEAQISYYCINSSDKPSEWLPYSDLPQEVKDNLDDYVLESETGYRYKDVKQSSSSAEIADLEANGWTYVKTEYTPYTAWQDDKIEVNNNLIGFEVDTQEVADQTVTWYKYSHYKYTDGGTVKYSPVEVAGFNCEYEEIVVENRLSIAGFTDDEISFYEYNSQQWFTQERVSGIKTQYRSRYQVAEYFKWTPWDIDAPASSETREYETDDVYRYANKNYHIVSIDAGIETDQNALLNIFVSHNSVCNIDVLEIYGYDLEGLYYDSKFTNEFDISSPITESVTLYAKYTPKKYTVTFQMKDGTELDVQQVEYLCSATEPETDSVPGYVFGGWDKKFDCITEDTVITGKYFKESEYARISLDSESVYLYSGTTAQLNAKITPENLTNEVVEWSSSDNSVAMVDNNGKITAVSQGVATITATVVKTKEKAICTVYVTQDLSTGILLKNESSLNYDELGYLRRVKLGTTVEKVNAEFVNTNLRFFNSSGTELGLSDNVGTGTEIRLYKNGEIVDKKTIVVTGDMNGDGVLNSRDVAAMNKTLILGLDILEYQALALDVNGDGYVDNRDISMMARYIVGKEHF